MTKPNQVEPPSKLLKRLDKFEADSRKRVIIAGGSKCSCHKKGKRK